MTATRLISRWWLLLPAVLLLTIALVALATGQVVPGVVVIVGAALAAVGGAFLRAGATSTRTAVVFTVVGLLVVTRVGLAVADGYLSHRRSECHDPSEKQRRLVDAVSDVGVGPLVAVRHRGIVYVAGEVAGEEDVAVFGINGTEVAAVNEVARGASTAEFDHLFGLDGVVVIEGPGLDGRQEGRLRAIERVGACAQG